jgi:predicted nucleic acid-binding protein
VKLVLDASVALSGLYTRAAAQEAMVAQHLLASIDNFEIRVPAHWHIEVANGMLRLERAGQLASAKIAKFVRQMDRLALLADTPPTAERATAIHKLAQNHGLTAYDAAYVELTIRSGSDLATFDRKLSDAARACGVAVFGQPHGMAEPWAAYGSNPEASADTDTERPTAPPYFTPYLVR